ncbi:hypothetical protein BT69DRAFT_1289229, partial [Atractiella rhizophila]
MNERKCEGTLTPFNFGPDSSSHHEYSPTPANSPQSILEMIYDIHTDTESLAISQAPFNFPLTHGFLYPHIHPSHTPQ